MWDGIKIHKMHKTTVLHYTVLNRIMLVISHEVSWEEKTCRGLVLKK